MKRIRQITAIAIALIILFSANVQAEFFAPDEQITATGNFIYTNLNNQITITGYKGTSKHVKIPSTIADVPVTAIGVEAFSLSSSLEKVTIPDTVTTIGSGAFSSCRKLTNITIPDSVKNIGSKAFTNCESLTSFVMPNDIEKCEADIFKGCKNVKFAFFTGEKNRYLTYTFFENDAYRPEAFFNVDKDYHLEDYVLFDKNKTTLIAYGRTDKFYTVPDSVKIIDEEAFEYNNTLIAVKLPKGLKNIKRRAFAEIPTLLYISIPSTISLIEVGAFYNCTNLKEVHYGGDMSKWNTISFGTGNTHITNPSRKYNSDLAFDLENLVVFTEDMKTLLYYHPMTSYILDSRPRAYAIPDTVTEIGSSAFSGSDTLMYITIPDSVTKIGKIAFYDCTSLKTVYAGNPENWCKIVFETSDSNPMNYSDNILFNDEILTEITIPESVSEIGDYTFYNFRTLKKVTMHNNITKIGNSAFYNCSALEDVTLSNSLAEISNYAFSGCKALKKITLPHSVKTIKSHIFKNSGLENISLHNNITDLYSLAFSACPSLRSVCLPENKIDTIPNQMFSNCSALETIYIPSNIKNFSINSFYNCKALKDIYFGGTEEEWDAINIDATNTDIWLATIHFEHKHTIDNRTVVIPGDEFTDGVATGTCTVCGYIDYEITPATHKHNYSYTVTTPATCLEDGIGTYTCSCSDSYTETIPSSGHKEITVAGKDATCTEKGYTESKKCSVCNKPLSTPEDIPSKGHTKGEWIVITEPETNKEGKKQQKCTDCGTVLDEKSIPALKDDTTEKPDEPEFIAGDTNGDGKVNAIDARIILRISAQLEKIENYNVPEAVFDLTGDGKVNALDARKALRIGAKLE